MAKTLIVYRLYDPAYSRGGQHGNKETLSVYLGDDNVIRYSLYGGWQDSGCGFAISNLQLKESLPMSPKAFKNTAHLQLRIAEILATGVGSHAIATFEFLNELKVKVTEPKKQKPTKLWCGMIPGIYGYGIMVIELTEDDCRKSLKRAFAIAKKANDGERSFNDSFIHWGGRILQVETGKHYGDDFTD